MTIFITLTNNITLLLALVFIYGLIRPRFGHLPNLQYNILMGVIFGTFAVIAMFIPFQFAPGVIYDGRGIIVAIAALFGGFIPGVIVIVMISLYRLSLGGVGAPLAVGIAVTNLAVGLLLRRYLARLGSPVSAGWLLLLGIVVALALLLWSSLLPLSMRQQMLDTLTLPVLVLFPAGVLLAGLLLQYMERQAQLADALHESEERYRTVVSVMADGVIVRYNDGTPNTLNQQAQRMIGPVADSMLSLANFPPGWQIIREDGTTVFLDEIPAIVTMRTGKPQHNVVIGLQNPQGVVNWFSCSSQPLVKADENKPYGVVTTFSNITHDRQMKEQLAHERNLLRTIVDSIPDYIYVKDTQHRFTTVNKALLTGNSLTDIKQVIGKTDFDFVPAEVAQAFYENENPVLVSGQAVIDKEEESIDSQTGQQLWFLTTKIPLRDSVGQVIGIIGISRNITERRKLQQQALELAAERERMTLLQRFVNDVSHDFRTPLTIINTSLYLLKKSNDPVRQEQHIEKLKTQTERLNQLLEDFLMMTNLDNTLKRLSIEPIDVNRLVNELVDDSLPGSLRKQHSLTFQPMRDLRLIEGDVEVLKQAILNVIVNALNFTPESGRITIRTYEQAQQAVIEIADTGIGIHAEEIPRIFDRLYRVDNARATTTGGTGVGLTIAQQIIEAHGGIITVESVVGVGSVFRLHLPITPT